mmetsp:Transcript_9909/g.26927  ORF Transcript_9909/g.26927 Transcript_9909/m.26927 type:complete len:200 (-) Transcript_9909:14-613(-)
MRLTLLQSRWPRMRIPSSTRRLPSCCSVRWRRGSPKRTVRMPSGGLRELRRYSWVPRRSSSTMRRLSGQRRRCSRASSLECAGPRTGIGHPMRRGMSRSPCPGTSPPTSTITARVLRWPSVPTALSRTICIRVVHQVVAAAREVVAEGVVIDIKFHWRLFPHHRWTSNLDVGAPAPVPLPLQARSRGNLSAVDSATPPV